MRYEDATEEAAREILPRLPELVGAEAPRIAAEIDRALSLPSGTSRLDALAAVLSSDARVGDWIARRIDQGSVRGTPPGDYGYEALPGMSVGATDAVKFICRTPNCPSPQTWWRSFQGEQTPRCQGCTRMLGRASE